MRYLSELCHSTGRTLGRTVSRLHVPDCMLPTYAVVQMLLHLKSGRGEG